LERPLCRLKVEIEPGGEVEYVIPSPEGMTLARLLGPEMVGVLASPKPVRVAEDRFGFHVAVEPDVVMAGTNPKVTPLCEAKNTLPMSPPRAVAVPVPEAWLKVVPVPTLPEQAPLWALITTVAGPIGICAVTEIEVLFIGKVAQEIVAGSVPFGAIKFSLPTGSGSVPL